MASATAVRVGKEASHGTVATAFTSIPCAFAAVNDQTNKVLEEDRQGQDVNFAMQVGHKSEQFTIGDSGVYHDSIGLWLCSAFGLPVKTLVATETAVWDNEFKFVDDPLSLSLQWQQPRRYTQAYQSLYGVVDQLEFKFDANGELTYSGSGVAMAETEISQITHTWSTVQPMPVWAGTVLVGGSANADLLSGSIKITRTRKPFFTIQNSQQPREMSIGIRTVTFDLVFDFKTKAEYDVFKNGTTSALDIVWENDSELIGTASHPQLQLHMGSTAYTKGEIDNGTDYPSVKISGSALYNSTDASLMIACVRSSVDYTA